MFCTACAAPTPADATTCPVCGRPIAPGAPAIPTPTGAARTNHPPRRRASDRRLLAALALLPVAAIVGVVFWLASVRAADHNAAWMRAESALVAGDYAEALPALAAVADNPEAARLRAAVAAALPVAQRDERTAIDRFAAGDDAGAIAALQSVLRRLPDYQQAAALQLQARAARTSQLRQALTDAEAGGNWDAAERTAGALLALDPGNRALAAQLAALRRDHAPIVVARDRQLWLIDPLSGDARLLYDALPATRPIWSPDRTRVAFIVGALARPDDAAALYVMNADGTGAREAASNVHPNAVAAWSPDGRKIAYTSVADWDLRQESGILAVHVVDLASGVDRDVTGLTGRHAVTPTWSPDSRYLAVVARDVSTAPGARGLADDGDVELIDLATGVQTNLTRGRLPGVIRVIWSPVAPALLAYSRAFPIGQSAADPAAALSLARIDVVTGAIDTLDRAVFSTAPGWAPAWSPDGTAVAYVDADGTVVVLRDGRRERIATGQELLGEVSWSPDGKRLLAPAANALDPSAIVDPNRPAAPPTLLPIAFDTTWPTGSPQWSGVAGQTAPPTALRVGLDR